MGSEHYVSITLVRGQGPTGARLLRAAQPQGQAARGLLPLSLPRLVEPPQALLGAPRRAGGSVAPPGPRIRPQTPCLLSIAVIGVLMDDNGPLGHSDEGGKAQGASHGHWGAGQPDPGDQRCVSSRSGFALRCSLPPPGGRSQLPPVFFHACSGLVGAFAAVPGLSLVVANTAARGRCAGSHCSGSGGARGGRASATAAMGLGAS